MRSIKQLRTVRTALLSLAISGIASYLLVAGGITQCPSIGNTCTGDNRSEVFILTGSPDTPTTTNINRLDAGGGNDRVIVSSIITTNITINGQDGNDVIFDGRGDGTLNGDEGNDRIDGNGGRDTINGGPGNDQLNGGIENDTINGNEGNDRIQGGPGVDGIDAGPGNDVIDPGPDPDGLAANPITGGGGNDTYILRRGETGNGTEYIRCTTNPGDRSVVRLVGFSKDDPALPRLPARLQPGEFDTPIRDGAGVFRIIPGPGRCIIVVTSR